MKNYVKVLSLAILSVSLFVGCADSNVDDKENKEEKTEQKASSKKEKKKGTEKDKAENKKISKGDDLKSEKKQNTSKTESKPQKEVKSESKSESKPQTESKPQPESQAKPKPTSTPNNKPQPQQKSESNPKPTLKPENKPKPKPANQPKTHTHDWVAKTIHHEEKGHMERFEIQPAWDEKEMMVVNVCNQCGTIITVENSISHYKEKPSCGGYHSEWIESGNIIHHEAVYEEEWVIDEEAWDETYYVCSQCGAKK